MTKNYEMYKKELESWKAITSIEAAKLGRVVALSLPEEDPSGIRQKVINSVNLDGADGYTNLIAFMDKEFKKDEISDMCEKIRHSHKFPMEASHKAYCFTKMPLVSFWLDLGFFFQLFLKLDIKAQLLRCYLASPNQIYPPSQSF